LYVYLASVGTNLLSSGHDDPKQIAASVIGFTTAITAIAYTTKLMHSTVFKKPARQAQLPQHQAQKREKARR
jgi:DNA topoisomerase IB